MYGTMAKMLKTTVYLDPALKARLEKTARLRGISEAELIREALDGYTFQLEPPRPRLPLFTGPLREPIAERDEELLADGFGRD